VTIEAAACLGVAFGTPRLLTLPLPFCLVIGFDDDACPVVGADLACKRCLQPNPIPPLADAVGIMVILGCRRRAVSTSSERETVTVLVAGSGWFLETRSWKPPAPLKAI